MSGFEYTEEEKKWNKILKFNLNESLKLKNDKELHQLCTKMEDDISSSELLLASLGYDLSEIQKNIANNDTSLPKTNAIKSEHDLYAEADQSVPEKIGLEDILSREQISLAWEKKAQIEEKFLKKTGIINPTDLKFLSLAIALQGVKQLLFSHFAKSFHYGDKIDESKRMNHNDLRIKQEEKNNKKKFREKHQKNHENGKWLNLLYQTPPYDITTGSASLGINMGGRYHRLATLGHDPILGWIFGTADILTDIITFTDFSSYRITRKPKMRITDTSVDILTLFHESYLEIYNDYLMLPTALFVQYCHLKSDILTKLGLPIPLLTVFNKAIASRLYRSQYDLLCFSRDIKIVGVSFAVSVIIDMIIGLIHLFYRNPEDDEDLYEVRTRKILCISNIVISTSDIVKMLITKNVRNMDLGQILNLCGCLFFDTKFLLEIKKEFVKKEFDNEFQREYEKVKEMYFGL